MDNDTDDKDWTEPDDTRCFDCHGRMPTEGIVHLVRADVPYRFRPGVGWQRLVAICTPCWRIRREEERRAKELRSAFHVVGRPVRKIDRSRWEARKAERERLAVLDRARDRAAECAFHSFLTGDSANHDFFAREFAREEW